MIFNLSIGGILLENHGKVTFGVLYYIKLFKTVYTKPRLKNPNIKIR